MSLKTAAEAAAVVLTLGILVSPVRAELELTDVQMDQVTAGAFIIVNSTDLSDSRGLVYTLNAATMTYTTPDGQSWRPLVITYYPATAGFPNNLAIGVLVNTTTGQTWDGGYTPPGPLGPCSTCFHIGPM